MNWRDFLHPIGGTLVVLAMMMLALYVLSEPRRLHPEDCVEQASASDGSATEISGSEPSVAAAPSEHCDPEAQPDRSTAEKDLFAQRIMAGAAVVTGLFAGLSAWFVVLTFRGQQTQFAAERRPWVMFEHVEFLHYPHYDREAGWVFSYVVVLNNVGQTPAVHLTCECEIANEGEDMDAPMRKQAALRERLRANRNVESSALFPTDFFAKEGSLEISRDELDEIRARDQEGQDPKDWVQHMTIYPIIYGVVRYESPHGGEVHTTTFMHQVTTEDRGFIGGFVFDPDSTSSDPVVSQINLKPFYKGSDAD